MPKQQFKRQADICKKVLDILHKAIELDPVNTQEYETGIEYTEGVMKASHVIVKACEIVESTTKEKAAPKTEETGTKNKKTKPTTKKSKSKEELKPMVEVEPAPVEEKEAEDLFAMFGD